MGKSLSKERIERAATTGTLTIDAKSVRSWSRLSKALRKVQQLRSMTISGTSLSDPLPHAFTQLSLWSSLTYLDLTGNGLTCACALGCAETLPRQHLAEAEERVRAQAALCAPPTGSVTLPLESLSLSGNSLHMLPPLLTTRFPRLRRLLCSDNAVPLQIAVALASCVGPAPALETVDLCGSRLSTLKVVDGPVAAGAAPLPALRELLLDRNCLFGTVSLGFCAAPESLQLPALRRLSLESQEGATPLLAVDPVIFLRCPGLKSLSLRGNAEEESIKATLGKSEVYRRWQEGMIEVVNKKIGAGGSAELIT